MCTCLRLVTRRTIEGTASGLVGAAQCNSCANDTIFCCVFVLRRDRTVHRSSSAFGGVCVAASTDLAFGASVRGTIMCTCLLLVTRRTREGAAFGLVGAAQCNSCANDTIFCCVFVLRRDGTVHRSSKAFGGVCVAASSVCAIAACAVKRSRVGLGFHTSGTCVIAASSCWKPFAAGSFGASCRSTRAFD
jgi:drug/metabolite transporter superfamily protein YnfA